MSKLGFLYLQVHIVACTQALWVRKSTISLSCFKNKVTTGIQFGARFDQLPISVVGFIDTNGHWRMWTLIG